MDKSTPALAALAILLFIVVAVGAYRNGRKDGARAERIAWGLPVGDGVTDDTDAIRRLVSGVACTGGTVKLPPGTYRTGP